MEELKRTLRELYIGVVFCTAVIAAVGCIFVSNRLSFLCGALLGGAVACVMAGHMAHCVGKAADMEEKAAVGYSKRSVLLRMAVMILAVLAAVLLPEIFHIVGVAAGILSLKAAAYLQPLVHKISFKILRKGG